MITLVAFVGMIGFYYVTFLQFGKLLLRKEDRYVNKSYPFPPFIIVEPNLSRSVSYENVSLDSCWCKVALRRLFCYYFYLI